MARVNYKKTERAKFIILGTGEEIYPYDSFVGGYRCAHCKENGVRHHVMFNLPEIIDHKFDHHSVIKPQVRPNGNKTFAYFRIPGHEKFDDVFRV